MITFILLFILLFIVTSLLVWLAIERAARALDCIGSIFGIDTLASKTILCLYYAAITAPVIFVWFALGMLALEMGCAS